MTNKKENKMDWQNIINIAGFAIVSVIGWFARQLWEAVQALKQDVQAIEVSLPTNYVRTSDLNLRFDKIDASLNRIFDKLENKQDKE